MATVIDSASATSLAASQRQIGVFVGLTWGWSALASLVVAASDVDFRHLNQAPPWVGALLLTLSWGPAIAALLTRRLFHAAPAAPVGWRRPPRRFFLGALAIPALYALGSYGLMWAAGLARFDPGPFTAEALRLLGFVGASPGVTAALYGLLLLLGGTLAFSLFALGEDLGYSGYLIPALAARRSFSRTALLTGLIWSATHYPQILLFKNFTLGAPPLVALIGLTLSLTAFSFVLTWLRLRTGSIWPGVVMHASHNVWFFLLLGPLTTESPLAPFVAGEQGLLTILLMSLIAWWFWRRRGALAQAG